MRQSSGPWVGRAKFCAVGLLFGGSLVLAGRALWGCGPDQTGTIHVPKSVFSKYTSAPKSAQAPADQVKERSGGSSKTSQHSGSIKEHFKEG